MVSNVHKCRIFDFDYIWKRQFLWLFKFECIWKREFLNNRIRVHSKKTRFFENSNTRILVRVKFIRTPIPVRHLSTTTCSLTPFYCLLPTETNNMWMNFQSRSKLLISATWILGWWTYISILYHKWGTSICLTVYIVEREKWEEGVITIEGSTCLWRHSDRIYGKSKVSTDRTALIVF